MWALLYCFMVVMLTSLSPCCLSSDEYPATPSPKAFVPIKEPSAQYPFDLKRPKRSAVQNISSFFYRNFAGEGLRRGYPLFFRFSFCVLAAGGGSYKLASHKGIDPKEEIGLFLIKCFISSLLHPKAEPDEVRLMAKFFSTVSFWQRIQVKSLAQPLMTPDMSMLERHMLLHTVSKLPSNKRREVIDIASKDITDRMGGFERTSLLINVFSKSIRIPGRTHPHREDKEDVVAKALILAPSNPTINEIQQIAVILSEFPVGERDFVFKKYKELQSIRAK